MNRPSFKRSSESDTSSSSHPNALIINFSAPELNHLAAAIAGSGSRIKYVRPYANLGRPCERVLKRATGVDGVYERTFGRRTLPDGLDVTNVFEVALVEDFAAAIARKLCGARQGFTEFIQRRIQEQVGRAASGYAKQATLVVGSYFVSQPAFRETVGVKVLNYPTAHHRYVKRLIAEEGD